LPATAGVNAFPDLSFFMRFLLFFRSNPGLCFPRYPGQRFSPLTRRAGCTSRPPFVFLPPGRCLWWVKRRTLRPLRFFLSPRILPGLSPKVFVSVFQFSFAQLFFFSRRSLLFYVVALLPRLQVSFGFSLFPPPFLLLFLSLLSSVFLPSSWTLTMALLYFRRRLVSWGSANSGSPLPSFLFKETSPADVSSFFPPNLPFAVLLFHPFSLRLRLRLFRCSWRNPNSRCYPPAFSVIFNSRIVPLPLRHIRTDFFITSPLWEGALPFFSFPPSI